MCHCPQYSVDIHSLQERCPSDGGQGLNSLQERCPSDGGQGHTLIAGEMS